MAKRELYEIHDSKTDKTYTISLDHEPTQADADKIINQINNLPNQLAESNKMGAKWNTGLGKAALDVGKAVISPENIGLAGATAIAPEFMVPALAGKGLLDTARAGYATYKDPSFENYMRTAGAAAGAALPLVGGKIARTGPGVPITGETINARMVPPETPPSPIDVPFRPVQAPPKMLEQKPIITPPPENPITGPKQLTEGTGPIVTPPPEGSISTSSVTGENAPAPKITRFKRIPAKVSTTGQWPNVEPPVAPVTPKAPTVKPKVTPKATTPEVTQAATPEAPMQNGWLKDQHPDVLQAMRPGATGKMADEIDMVMRKKANEQAANDYQQLLGDLQSHGKGVGHIVLRDIAQKGKEAGLDHETVANDIQENLHPDVSNPANKAFHAATKVFNPEEDY